jgi:hypothetical protein
VHQPQVLAHQGIAPVQAGGGGATAAEAAQQRLVGLLLLGTD